MPIPLSLGHFVVRARSGELAALGTLVERTQEMAYAVAWQLLRSDADARDVVQEAYLAAFRRLGDLVEADTFAGWLRRIVITTALNHRRRVRTAWLSLNDAPEPPVLDAEEEQWSEEQRRILARALLTLTADERRLCERRYHGGWEPERLAQSAGIDAATMRKRLQRIRDKLRKEVEMDEKRTLAGHAVPAGLPSNIMELMARPRLVDLPDNPVGAALSALQSAFSGFVAIEVDEQVDLAAAQRQLGGDAVYIERSKLHQIEADRFLRYDLTLPLLLKIQSGRLGPGALRLAAAGKVYRREHESATHLEAFHQLELFAIDDRGRVDVWWFAGRILDAVDQILPKCEVRLTPTAYPMCVRAWSLDVRHKDEWIEVMAWGEYAGWVLRGLGADPLQQVAFGAGFGLERVAALRYGIDDVRKIATARVA
jgi:RNA polymerase sigma factor (sigma-70 family)